MYISVRGRPRKQVVYEELEDDGISSSDEEDKRSTYSGSTIPGSPNR